MKSGKTGARGSACASRLRAARPGFTYIASVASPGGSPSACTRQSAWPRHIGFTLKRAKCWRGVQTQAPLRWISGSRSATPKPLVKLIDEYLTRYAEPRKRDKGASDKRALNADIRPRWGDMKAKDIVRRDVIRLLDSVVERGSPIQANRLLQVTRKMFTFGVQRGILESSPCNLIERPSPEHARTRVLDTAEIKSVWTNLDSSKMHAGTRLALKLLLVTGQRRGEVVAAPVV